MILDPNFILRVGLALLSAAVLSFAVTPLVKRLAQKVGAMDVPTDSRRMHHHPIPRMGGLAIFLAFLASVLIFAYPEIDREIRGILLGAVIIVMRCSWCCTAAASSTSWGCTLPTGCRTP